MGQRCIREIGNTGATGSQGAQGNTGATGKRVTQPNSDTHLTLPTKRLEYKTVDPVSIKKKWG
ncbi:hypothetical protein, partial [Bacillus cereus group sp. N8]|uniref:hypothetical protein n=1 Tax=Bacillus cereus group sp. N8 TaxID=2794584 RepID=UPI001A7E5432